MYLDAFEDNQNCKLEDKVYPHGADICDMDGMDCKTCIDGWLVDKVRLRNSSLFVT